VFIPKPTNEKDAFLEFLDKEDTGGDRYYKSATTRIRHAINGVKWFRGINNIEYDEFIKARGVGHKIWELFCELKDKFNRIG
jgi:hypothetical protein